MDVLLPNGVGLGSVWWGGGHDDMRGFVVGEW